MGWECVTITAEPEDTGTLTDMLVGEGIAEFAVMDPREAAELLSSSLYRDYLDESILAQKKTRISVYVQEGESGMEKRTALRRFLVAAYRAEIPVSLHVDDVAPDWMENWKKFFKPLPVGNKFMIKPSWETLAQPGERLVLEIDPSSSFGTGSHETTRLCLENLEGLVFPGAEVLDMGCGSGILGVGALLLGAGRVTAVDVEADAVCATRKNMEANGMRADRYRALCSDLLQDDPACAALKDQPYDIIAANIVADVLIAMAPRLFPLLKQNGRLILSGVISERRRDVEEAFTKAGFSVDKVQQEGEWMALVLERVK